MAQGLDNIRQVIRENDNIVLVGGSEMMRETGLNGFRAEHMAYEVEEMYGYSPDDILSSIFFTRQVGKFYDYYKNVILNKENSELTPAFKAVAALEERGKLSAIVTRTVYQLFQKAGCKNVVDLYGSVEENRCPVCGKIFDAAYIKRAADIPKCDKCEVPLRPGFSLLGEQIDNGRLTKTVNAIENADVLLVAGTSLNSLTWASTLRYYEGDKLVLVNTEPKSGDERAAYRAYGNISDIFCYIMDYDEKA
ncbi:MAG: hypothetical protein LUH14_04560 [Clostridiaceae bacterium]|nr:hypothetical protein [Clostridiaceae bacterium]